MATIPGLEKQSENQCSERAEIFTFKLSLITKFQLEYHKCSYTVLQGAHMLTIHDYQNNNIIFINYLAVKTLKFV